MNNVNSGNNTRPPLLIIFLLGVHKRPPWKYRLRGNLKLRGEQGHTRDPPRQHKQNTSNKKFAREPATINTLFRVQVSLRFAHLIDKTKVVKWEIKKRLLVCLSLVFSTVSLVFRASRDYTRRYFQQNPFIHHKLRNKIETRLQTRKTRCFYQTGSSSELGRNASRCSIRRPIDSANKTDSKCHTLAWNKA